MQKYLNNVLILNTESDTLTNIEVSLFQALKCFIKNFENDRILFEDFCKFLAESFKE